MTPGGSAVGFAAVLILLMAALLLLFGGCVHVATEPALPYPERPPITVTCRDGACCMSRDDAVAFLRWLQKLNEFEQARAESLR